MNLETKKVNPLYGIGVFLLVILMLLFVAVPLQGAWGMYGVAVTELFILILGIAPVLIFKMDFKKVFPIKKPKLLQLLGIGIIWVGSYLTVLIITLIIQYFFPGLAEESAAIQNLFTSVPALIAFFIIALMPAVCEEVLHRGFILATFGHIKNKWVIVLCMGLIFGLFHLDPYRFLATAVLGAVLTYIMIETKNILLPMLFHFVNNAFSTGIAFLTKDLVNSTASQGPVPITAIAIFLIIGSAIPFLILLGAWLLSDRAKEQGETVTKKKMFKNVLISLTIAMMLFVSGVVLLAMNYKSLTVIYESNVNMAVNKESDNLTMDMHITQSSNYKMNLTMNNERGVSDLIIKNEAGEEVYNVSAGQLTIENESIKLEKGDYTLVVIFHLKDAEEYYEKMGFGEMDIEKLGLLGDLNEFTYFELKISLNLF